jgi:hypothetical protein
VDHSGDIVLCSGAFVSGSVVLVSAHCVVDTPMQDIKVRISNSKSNVIEMQVENVIIHPGKKKNANWKYEILSCVGL